jgi:hypothetical protein
MVLTLKEMIEQGGVPPKVAQKMMHDQMELAVLIMKAPKSMQGNTKPLLQLMDMQQEHLKQEYGFRSKMMDLTQKKLEAQGKTTNENEQKRLDREAAQTRVETITKGGIKKAGIARPTAEKPNKMTDPYNRKQLIQKDIALTQQRLSDTYKSGERKAVSDKLDALNAQNELIDVTDEELIAMESKAKDPAVKRLIMNERAARATYGQSVETPEEAVTEE